LQTGDVIVSASTVGRERRFEVEKHRLVTEGWPAGNGMVVVGVGRDMQMFFREMSEVVIER